MSNNKQQTALQGFWDKIALKLSVEQINEFIPLLNQAKQMEKEQIENAYEIGFADAWDDARYDDEPTYIGAEQYYEQTYGGNNGE